MENIIIRQATIHDLDTLLKFEQGVISSERPFDATLKDEHTHYYNLSQLLTAQNVTVMVAVAGSQIIGSGYARIEDSKPYLKHQQHAYLGFMYTHPAYRGKGINQKIIEVLKQWSLRKI